MEGQDCRVTLSRERSRCVPGSAEASRAPLLLRCLTRNRGRRQIAQHGARRLDLA